MKPTGLNGVFFDRGLKWTLNRVPGRKIYGELLRLRGDDEYRAWNPGRSKMGALSEVHRSPPWPGPKDSVLYLGASSGTTVSHISDITDGTIFAVEFSPRSARDLLWNMEPRDNVVPILADAGEPASYASYLADHVDILIQDVAQRHQVDIFLRNIPFLRPGGHGFLFVKGRSISVSEPLHSIFEAVRKRLKEAGLEIVVDEDLAPFEADHRAIVVRRPGGRA